ncbi:putative ribonuclease H-like domain-containing protein [Tanacetum coccineum]
MNYVPVAAGTITNESAVLHNFDSPSRYDGNGEPKSAADDQKQVEDGPDNENDEKDKSNDDNSPKEVNAAGQHVNNASPEVNIDSFKLNIVDPSVNIASSYELDSPKDMFKMRASHTLKATHVEFFSDEAEPEVDLGNILNSYIVSTTPNIRIHKDHPITNVIGDVKSSIQTRRMTKPTSEQGFLSAVWILVDLPIGTKWVFRNKKDERGIVIRNKARIEAIRLFLAYASFMGFLVYQMDVKSAFLYGTIKEEVYVTQPPGFKDPDNPDKVYKVVKALYGLHQAPRGKCKKQTVVVTSTTEVEYVAAASCYLLTKGFDAGRVTSKGSAPELVKRETDTLVTCTVDALKHSETLCAITMRYMEIGKSSRIDDKVVQDHRQRDDYDLQDERQDQPKEEEVEPRRSKRARTEKLFGPDVTPPKSGRSGMVTLGCDFKAQSTSHRKRPQKRRFKINFTFDILKSEFTKDPIYNVTEKHFV